MNFRNASLWPALLLCLTTIAQDVPDSLNMVENGSFEVLDGKLKRLGYIEVAKGWKSPPANRRIFSVRPLSVPR